MSRLCDFRGVPFRKLSMRRRRPPGTAGVRDSYRGGTYTQGLGDALLLRIGLEQDHCNIVHDVLLDVLMPTSTIYGTRRRGVPLTLSQAVKRVILDSLARRDARPCVVLHTLVHCAWGHHGPSSSSGLGASISGRRADDERWTRHCCRRHSSPSCQPWFGRDEARPVERESSQDGLMVGACSGSDRTSWEERTLVKASYPQLSGARWCISNR
eukprot:scaffold225_cov388-Prasinococcus_capsulatus_cf.AAC.8